VLEEAKEFGADLVVMSSHDPGLRTYFIGSNAAQVVRHAHCSVMVVRARPEPQ
jgi:nucleotide-binding universal stress UspA family protein